MSLHNEQMPHRIALLDACMLACDQCLVLSHVSHADAQARALESGRKLGGLRRQGSGHMPSEGGAAVTAANLKMAAA